MKKGYTERKNQEIDIYIENQEYIANNYVMKCFSVYMILYTGLFIVNQMSIFTIDKKLMMLAYIPSLIIYFFTCLITKRLSMSHSSMKYIILFCFMSVSTITGVFLTYHVVVAMVLPLLYALLYSSKATMRYIYILTIISTIIIVYGGYYYGLCDANMVLLTEKNLQGYLSEVLVPGDFDHSVTDEKSQKVTRENDQKSHLTPLIIQFPEDCQKQFLPFL